MGMIKDVVETTLLLADRRRRRTGRPRLHRPFLVAPLRSTDPSLFAHLVNAVRSGAGIPLVYAGRENKVADFLRRARAIYVLQDTTPKSAFAVCQWQHLPAAHLDAEVVYTATAGSALFVELASTESSGHFLRSVKAGRSTGPRPIVIATPENLCRPSAWLRCIQVDAREATVDASSPARVALPSSAALKAGETAATRMRQKDVPPDALWLICDSDDQSPPSPKWGDTPETFTTSPRPSRSTTEGDHLDAMAKSWRTNKLILWLLAGLGVPVLAAVLSFMVFWLLAAIWWLAPALRSSVSWSFSTLLSTIEVVTMVSAVWFAVSALVAINALWAAAKSKCVAYMWRRKEGFKTADWLGRTKRTVFLTRLLDGISFKPGKSWPDLWPTPPPNPHPQADYEVWPGDEEVQ